MEKQFESIISKATKSVLVIAIFFAFSNRVFAEEGSEPSFEKEKSLTQILQSINKKKQVYVNFNPAQTSSIYIKEEEIDLKDILTSLNKLLEETDLEVKSAAPNYLYIKSVQKIRLKGYVVEQSSGKPISNVTVLLQGKDKVQTDNLGHFAFNLRKGTYQLSFAEKNHYNKNLQVSLNTPKEIKIEMKRIRLSNSNSTSKKGKTIPVVPVNLVQPDSLLSVNSDTLPALKEYLNKTPEELPIAPDSYAIKTNLLQWALFTPNIAIEKRISNRWTIGLSGTFHYIKFGSADPLELLLLESELRYWTDKSFSGNFFGFNAFYGNFDTGDVRLSSGLFKNMGNHRYKGYLYGAGISYGYQWKLSNRWNLEATAGLGYAHVVYDKYRINKLRKKIKDENYNYFGPTKVAINLIYTLK